jgi:flagellar hook-basal body protein
MLGSMYSGISGLRNHQTRMDVIGNNIANVNTTGYKKSRVIFQDMLYQNLKGATSATQGGKGGTNPMSIGTGMALSSIDQIHTPAPTAGTNKMTDMAINGDGYFILGIGNERYYTRAGAFDFDTTGNLVSNANGMHVMGWVANPQDWTLATNQAVQPIDISRFKELPPRATTDVVFTGNLDAALAFKAGLNEQQSLSFATIPSGGQKGGFFRLNFAGQTTDWIQVGANTTETASNIQTALENLSNVGKGNIQVTWDAGVNHYNITFKGSLGQQNVDLISFIPGPVTAFDGGQESITGDNMSTYLSFADVPEGGTENGTFVLSVGNLHTGLIKVGATTDDTVNNIQTAINDLSLPGGAQATVSWDDISNRYNIVFNRDPGGALSFTRVNALFEGGAATVGGTAQDATITFNTPSGGTPGGNFLLSFKDPLTGNIVLNTGLIEVGQDETETALNMEHALNSLSGELGAIVSWDPVANNYKVHFKTVPTGDLTVSTPVSDPDPTLDYAVFDGGDETFGTQHPTIAFAPATPGGGTAGGAFCITIGQLQTGPIIVASTEDETAQNIENALNQLSLPNGAVASVSWDDTNERYQIDFSVDPQQAIRVSTVTPFNGGKGAVSLIQDGQAPLIIAPRNEVQTLAFADNANGGTPGTSFRLEYNGVQTELIAVGDTPADTAKNIQAALEAIPAIGTGNVAVNWDENNKRYNIVFQGALRETDVKQLGFVSAPIFDGGEANILNTQYYNLSFATTPAGGTAGGNFMLSFDDSLKGPINTELIVIDEKAEKTAEHIQEAINKLDLPNGAKAEVTWDAVNSRYQIKFDHDPGIPMSFSAVSMDFSGGKADIQPSLWNKIKLSFLTDPANPNSGTKGTERGSFILSIGGKNTGIITVDKDDTETVQNIKGAIALLGITVNDVNWDDDKKCYSIDFDGNPGTVECYTAAKDFDGGPGTVSSTQHPSLYFGTDPQGGDEGGNFVLTFSDGNVTYNTGIIAVGLDTTATATNIKNAINALNLPNGAKASVSWDDVNNRYQIDFDHDPELTMGFSGATAFDGGTADVQQVAENVQLSFLTDADDPDSGTKGTPGGSFILSIGGKNTGIITVDSDDTETVQNIKGAIEQLGIEVNDVSWDDTNNYYSIEFNGDPETVECYIAATDFGGGPGTVSSTQHPSLSFGTIPEGGTDGGNFVLTFSDGIDTYNTDIIAVGLDTTATATNIKNAINALNLPNGAKASVSWDDVNNRYQIDFDHDPELTMGFSGATAFDDGTAAVKPSYVKVQLSFADPADPTKWTTGGTEGGSFILSIGDVNTGIIKVGSSPAVTARNIKNAINELEVHNGAAIIQATDVQWDPINHRYEISFNVDPEVPVTFSAAAQFDGGTEKLSGTQRANLAFDIDPDGGSEGGSFILTLGTGSDALKTNAISIGSTPQETEKRIQDALNNLPNNATLPNDAKATVKWDDINKVYKIDFSSDPGLEIGFVRKPFDGGTSVLSTLLQGSPELEYPASNECIITSKEVYNSLGTPETLYFRFFKYEIQPGDGPGEGSKQPVSRWGCDISTNQMFQNTDGYNPLTDFSAIDINGEQPRYGTGTKLYRVYNLEFDENGAIKNTNPHMSLPFNQQIPVPGSGARNPMIDVDLSLITQHDGESTIWIDQNGYEWGQLKSYNVDSNGSINGVYNNGEIKELARVALASFANPAGLIQQGGTLFKDSINSGSARVGKSGDAGLGTITPSNLEMSNVDLSEEFTDMIVTQRGFQANSRMITTSDEMLQELMNLKR